MGPAPGAIAGGGCALSDVSRSACLERAMRLQGNLSREGAQRIARAVGGAREPLLFFGHSR
jgi:hypothetical protein